MPRWRWHLTSRGHPDEPVDGVGLATGYSSGTGAYSPDYVHRIQRGAEVPEPRQDPWPAGETPWTV
jgi:hypothetical protein